MCSIDKDILRDILIALLQFNLPFSVEPSVCLFDEYIILTSQHIVKSILPDFSNTSEVGEKSFLIHLQHSSQN